MEAHIDVMIYQLILFSTLIVTGFVAQRLRLLSDQTIDGISAVTVKLILPLMIVTTVVSGGTVSQLLSMGPFLLCGFLMIFILLLTGWVSATLLRLKQPTKNIHIAVSGFPNSGFMGFPLLMAMFPEEAPLAVSTYSIVDVCTLWTIGVLLTTPNGGGKIDWKKLIQPATIALAIGVVMLLLNIRPENACWDALTGLGGTCKYISLVYIGADIGRKGFQRIFEKPQIFAVIPVKLILAPILVNILLRLSGLLSDVNVLILTIYSMLPSMVVISMLAKANGSDDQYASAGLLVTTVCSMFTMPLVLKLISMLPI